LASSSRPPFLLNSALNLRFIDWIWCIRGSVPLAAGQSSDDAFVRLSPLLQKQGTTHERTGDTMTFRKKDQAAQDKMSIFEGGVLQIENGGGGGVLRYVMTSRALLFCFLAPLLFLAFAQLNITLGKMDKQATEAAKKAGKDPEAKKKDEKKKPEIKLNVIDKALGAPEPEKPKKDGKDKKEDKKFSPTSAYVFAGIFAALWLIGRVLEDWLIKRLFRKSLLGA
jgi:hypothetical protein